MIGFYGAGLVYAYKGRSVVKDVDINLCPGEIVGLLGPNGSGKTTTFKLLSGLLRPQAGRVELDGTEVTRWPLWRRARRGLAYVPQQSTIVPSLTVAENIRLGIKATDEPAVQEECADLIAHFGLSHVAQQKGGTLSGGERKRTELVRALASRPKYLLVDEPFAGLDPLAMEDVSAAIGRLASTTVGILLTDHNIEYAMKRCSRIYIIDNGKHLAHGTPSEIWQDKEVQKRYLGQSAQETKNDLIVLPRLK